MSTTRDGSASGTAGSAASSLVWNYAGSLVAVLLQVGYTAYTGRTVAPTSFGAYAIALTVAQLLGYFANAGLATCLLRADRLDISTVKAAHRLAAGSGVASFALLEAVAPLCAALWRMPEVTLLLRILGCQFLVQPTAAVALAALRRIGHTRAAVIAEVIGQLGGAAAGMALLARGWNPAGLAVASPVGAAVSLAAATVLLSHRPLPTGPPVTMGDLLRSSGFLAGYSLVQFTTNSLPMWVAGRLLGPSAAGWFSRASLLSGIPLTFLAQGLNWAALPALADRRAGGRPLGRAVEHAMCMASAAAFVGFGALAGIGPAALELLLGPGWDKAASLVPVLAAGSAVALLCSFGVAVDQACGSPRALLGTQLAVTAGTVAGVAAAVGTHSLFLLASTAAAGQAAGHLTQLLRWHRTGLLRAGTTLRTHAWHATVGTAFGGAAALGAQGRPPAHGVVCGLLAMLPVLVCCALMRTRIPLYAAAAAMGLVHRGKRSTPVPGAS